MSNINCNKFIFFSLGYYKRCLQCAKNSHKSALPFNVENHYIVNKTEKGPLIREPFIAIKPQPA